MCAIEIAIEALSQSTLHMAWLLSVSDIHAPNKPALASQRTHLHRHIEHGHMCAIETAIESLSQSSGLALVPE